MSNIRYLDFDLQIQRNGDGYRAHVLTSPAGQASTDFSPPFLPLELENFLLRVSRTRRGTRRIDSPEMEAAKAFGTRLFETAFGGEVRSALRSSLAEADRQGAGLRIRLRLTDTPELSDLPWEYLYDSARHRFLVLSIETPLVRYLDLPERMRPLGVVPPLRVLVMISSPHDYPQLDVEGEWARLHEALGHLEQQGLLLVERVDEATLVALQRRLRRGPYHVFHFIGHGKFDQQAQDGQLILEDERGRGRLVSSHYLGMLLHDLRSLRLAVLNACEGARTSRTDPFAGTAQSLAQEGIPAVIAMQFEITDEAAITFAHEFYQAVVDGYPVDAALAEARKAIFAQGNDVEWGTPVLYLRSLNGQIFDVTATSPPRSPQERKEDQLQGQLSALFMNAHAAMAQEDWPVALETLQAVLALEPTNPEAAAQLLEVRHALDLHTLYTTGQKHEEAGRWQEALDCFRQIQERQTNYKNVSARMEAVQGEMARKKPAHPPVLSPKAVNEVIPALRPARSRGRWALGALTLLLVVSGFLIWMNWPLAEDHEPGAFSEPPPPLPTPTLALGDPGQQFTLGEQYYYGRGVAQDYTQAMEWYRKAAEQGHAAAQNKLGVMLATGRGVAKNEAQAVEWYRKAAEQGNKPAQDELRRKGLSW
jgi:TPR repeat protein